MSEIDFSNITANSQVINIDRKYWLVRTMGGDYYSDFVKNGYIAIGYNPVHIKEIQLSVSYATSANEKLFEIVSSKSGLNNPHYITNQLLRFCSDIKKNDVVIVPGWRSDKISIGIVDSSDIYWENEAPLPGENCPFNKRKKVKWVQETTREQLNPKLQLLFSSRHIVSNIDYYSTYIDSSVNDYYVKDGHSYLVLKVKTSNDIDAKDFTVVSDLLNFLDEFATEYKIPVSSSDIKLKVNVQSPGDLLMKALSPEGIAILGVLVVLINGGGLKIEKLGFNLHTDGLIKNINEFLDRRKDRKLKETIAEKIKHLEIENPGDLVKIMEVQNKSREKY